MPRQSTRLAVAALVSALFLTGPASAQSTIPNYAFVRDATGQVFVVAGGTRIAVPMHPASEDQLAAIPWTGQWLNLKADGSGYERGPKPEWAIDTLAPPPAPPAIAAAAVAAPPTPTPQSAPVASTPITLSNRGGQKTRPFDLAGGTYRVTWSGTLATGEDNLIVRLGRTDGERVASNGSLVNVILGRSGQPSSGETQLYGVKPGNYYLDVVTSAQWTVTLTPLAP